MKKLIYILLILLILTPEVVSAESNDYRASNNSNNEKEKDSIRQLFDFLNGFTEYVAPTDVPQATPIPTPAISGGNPIGPSTMPTTTTEFAQLIDRITAQVHGSCTSFGIGVVNRHNSYCVNPVSSIIGGTNGTTTVSHLKNSADSYYNLQCVGCAVAMAAANARPYRGWGNAKQHADQSVLGYKYLNSNLSTTRYQVVPGSLFILTGGTYGHIGMVTEIIRDSAGYPDSFRAQECNYQRPGYFSHEKTWSFTSVAGFQVPIN